MIKPTIIGQLSKSALNSPSQLISPTIIGTLMHKLKHDVQDEMWDGHISTSSFPPAKPKPTVIGFSSPRVTAEKTAVVENTTKIITSQVKEKITASVMPGTIRKNISVTVNELSQLFPVDSLDNLTFAAELLQKINLETFTTDQAAALSKNEQRQYSQMVDAYLVRSTSANLKSNLQYMQRFNAIFIQLSDALLNQNKEVGFFQRKPITVKEQLEKVMPEITQLKGYMDEDNLVSLKETMRDMDQILNDFKLLTEDLLAFSIVIRYLLTVIPSTDLKYNLLEQNDMDILRMITMIQSADANRIATKVSIEQLIRSIEATVMLELPAWMERIYFLSTADLTETECFALNQKLQSFIQA